MRNPVIEGDIDDVVLIADGDRPVVLATGGHILRSQLAGVVGKRAGNPGLAAFIGKLRKLITPVVTGTIITLMGLSLIKVAVTDMAGGFGASDLGAASNLGLAALVLPAPTLDLQIRASDIAHRAPPNTELFPTVGSEREGLTRLIERLQARLGRDAVRSVQAVADHRPERARRRRPAHGGPGRLAAARALYPA